MKYKNKFNLPDAFVRAAVNDPYDNGGSDFSATSLANPSRAEALIEMHFDEIEIDVSSRVAAIIGQGSHHIAERAAREGDLCEERLFALFEVDGVTYKISGQIDLYEPDAGHLLDWKTTKAYAFSKKAGSGKKPEWIEQLNICAELLRRNGHYPKKLSIIALLKDWDRFTAGTASMPASEVLSVELPMWDEEKTIHHIETRIRSHVSAREILPECNPKETWGGNRCGNWCDASGVCEQFQQSKKTGLLRSIV